MAAPGGKPGQNAVSAKFIARMPRNLWSVLQRKSILDISETLLPSGEISATTK